MSDLRHNPLLDSLAPKAPLWQAAELAAILRHQLAARLEPELARWTPELLRDLRGSIECALRLTKPFAEVLHDPETPSELLEAIKQTGKSIATQSEVGVPREVGKMLYFLAIAAAELKGRSISQLSKEQLHEGLTWAAGVNWIDNQWRQWIAAGLRSLETSQS